METNRGIVLVTGVSSLIGNACATLLAKKGYTTYGACRDPARYDKNADEFFELLNVDLLDDSSVTRAADSILTREGRLDHLVCCGDLGLVGSVEGCSIEEARRQFDADYLGPLRLVKAFLPSMRQAGFGRIIIATSLAARIGIPFLAHYSAVVRGLEALVESLRLEVRPFGIEACSLELGAFRAVFSESRWIPADKDASSPYRGARAILERGRSRIGGSGSVPITAAKTVCALLSAKRLPEKKSIAPFFVRLAVLGRRILPPALFEGSMRHFFHTTERKE